MEKVGILIVSYGSREAAIADALSRSSSHKTELYIVDKQRNPFNVKKAKEHVVIPDLSISEIAKFVSKRKDKIDFGIVGPEKPIIEGVRDLVERQTKVPLICPTKEFAIEASKVAQRLLFERVAPQANPKFKIFRREDYKNLVSVKKDVYAWLDKLRDQAVVKPERPAAGKGVGVWGDHFSTREQLFEHFVANYQQGAVIIEEKVDGEESSFQLFCDGRRIVPLPETRDYKRAFDGDNGPNTGGMGCYKDTGDVLPFMAKKDKEKEIELVNKLFKELRKRADSTDLRGIPFYGAFIHTVKGPKILEINSRPGDPEIQCLLPLLKDDFVDICYRILEGNIKNGSFDEKASVVVYKAPPSYGGYLDSFAERVKQNEVNTPVDLSEAERLSADHRDSMYVYPGSMEIREDGLAYALSSRAVCVVGTGDSTEEARETSLRGIQAIKGGALWHRNDIASKEHITKSIEHMSLLRTREK
jgi:phosphoribosylamine--glycine ligase